MRIFRRHLIPTDTCCQTRSATLSTSWCNGAQAWGSQLERGLGDLQDRVPGIGRMAEGPVSISDDLNDLVALYEKGALTQDEFDAAKARLLRDRPVDKEGPSTGDNTAPPAHS